MKKPIFVAHRAAWRPSRRENTVAAIERACASKRFDYIELDVRRTRSDDQGHQTSIIMHDSTLDRLYDLYRIPKIKRNRAGQDIGNLTISIIRGEEIEIATLNEAMRAAKGCNLNLEIKSEAALEPMLETINEAVSKYAEWSYESIVISSMNWKLLESVKQQQPKLRLAMVYTWRHLPKPFGRRAKQLEAEWLVFNKWLAILTPLARLVSVERIGVYSVNSQLEIKLLSWLPITVWFTDSVTLPDMLE